jgi:bifunctional N-acetylglucosamine-1-phosphate-uridyltransferase/glucosamine-1-phosphate-acetyltransferase GlmU-like protein
MTWSIVLAAEGAGARLAEHARGRGTLLAKTLRRASRFSSPDRIAVVTAREHHAEADEVLRHQPEVSWLEQLSSRGTTPGIALSLVQALRRDDREVVLLLPSDQEVADEGVFAAAIDEAIELATRSPHRVAVLGAEPGERPDGRDWIVPAGRAGGAVAGLVEEAPASEIPALVGAGALLNTCVVAARPWTLAGLLGQHASQWWRSILRSWPDPVQLEATCAALPPSRFSTDVLKPAIARLELVRVGPDAGWSGVATPAGLAQEPSPASPVQSQITVEFAN